jgi:hypothetical protein
MFKQPFLYMLSYVLCLPIQELSAQDTIFSPVASQYELNGYIRTGIYAGPVSGQSGYETKDFYGETSLKLSLPKAHWGDAFSEIRLWNRDNHESSALSFTLRETFINVYPGDFDLRMGQQVVQWGKADSHNPTNIITPMDLQVFSPNEDDRRLSNFLIRSYYYCPALRLEAIWIPVYKSSVLPFSGIELPDELQLSKPDYPDININHSTFAIKMNIDGTSADASVSYFNGFAPMPGICVRLVNNRLTIVQTAYRLQMIGADFSTIVGTLGLRGEFAFKEPLKEENTWQSIPQNQIEYILGLDKEYGDFSFILQYIGKHVFDYKELVRVDQNSENFNTYKIILWNRILSGQLKEWSHAVSFRPVFKCFHQTLHIELLGYINFSTNELFLLPKLRYSIADDLNITVGVQLYDGNDDTLFGLLDESNSAGFIELLTSF